MTAVDAVLVEAERELRAALNADCWDRIEEACQVAARTEAITLVGAIAQLRIVLHPTIGLDAGKSDTDLPMLKNVLATVERLAGAS